MLSNSPPDRDVIWTEAGVQGAFKQIQRLWRLVCEIERVVGPAAQLGRRVLAAGAAVRRAAHAALAKIEDQIERLASTSHRDDLRTRQLARRGDRAIAADKVATTCVMLSPSGRHPRPVVCADDAHLAEECWQVLGNQTMISMSRGLRPTAA